jgi:anion-transporting  ArsA/GET3 family ATPase
MKIRIFVGTGGVGKTSVAAASALLEAYSRSRCLVLTIDPAQRLRSALNLQGTGIEHRVDVGEGNVLWAGLLDVKATLDRAVEQYGEPDQARTVLSHPVYKVLIQSLSGMQELMAIERIDQAIKQGFQSIFVDTAPSRHAFEFLDKPEFFAELVNFPAVRLVGRTYKWWESSAFSRLGKKSVELYSKVEQVLGSTLVRQVLDFYAVFRTIAEGYADRARRTSELLRDPSVTEFAIVTTPAKAPRDADYFWQELTRRRYPVTTLIVNRVWPSLETEGGESPAGELARLIAWYRDVSRSQIEVAEMVRKNFGPKVREVLQLPELPCDVDGIAALRQIAENLDSVLRRNQAK